MRNLEKKRRANDFVDQTLVNCKNHNGPVTSVSELKALVNQKSPNLKKFLRQEIQYQRVTHPVDAEVRKELYKVNSLSMEEMLENLTTILCGEHEAEDGVVFPCEDEIMAILQQHATSEVAKVAHNDLSLQPNQPVAVIWDTKSRKQWYIGFYLDMNDDETYRIDHLERNSKENKLWRRPYGKDDIQDTEEIQIVPVSVIGEWDLNGDEPVFVVSNDSEIQECFERVCSVFDV